MERCIDRARRIVLGLGERLGGESGKSPEEVLAEIRRDAVAHMLEKFVFGSEE